MIIPLDPLPDEQGWKRPNLSGNRIIYPYKSSPRRGHKKKEKKPSNKCQNSVKNSLVKWNSREKVKSYTNTKRNLLSQNIMEISHPDDKTIRDSQFFTRPGNILLPQSIKEIKKENKWRNHYIICLSGMVFRDM